MEAMIPRITEPQATRWRCPFCGRDKFDRPYQPHNCVSGFRKRFRNAPMIKLVVPIRQKGVSKMLDLDAIEAAEKAMTPGPLTQKHCRVSDRFDNTLAYTNHRADAEGIVILRNAAPDLIARIRDQDAEIARLRALCGEAAESHSSMLEYAGATNTWDDHCEQLSAASRGEL